MTNPLHPSSFNFPSQTIWIKTNFCLYFLSFQIKYLVKNDHKLPYLYLPDYISLYHKNFPLIYIYIYIYIYYLLLFGYILFIFNHKMTLWNHIYTYLFICTTICPYLPSLIILIYAVCLVSYFRINLLTYTNAYMVISINTV